MPATVPPKYEPGADAYDSYQKKHHAIVGQWKNGEQVGNTWKPYGISYLIVSHSDHARIRRVGV